MFAILDPELRLIMTAYGFYFGFGALFGLTLASCATKAIAWGCEKLAEALFVCGQKLFSFINLNPEKAMKTYLIMTVIGAVLGALVGGICGWLVGLIWPCVIVGTVAGLVGIFTWKKWPSWFATQYVETWHSGAIVFVLCVVFGGAVGAMTGWCVRGLGLGALFGVIVVGMSYGVRHLPINVQ